MIAEVSSLQFSYFPEEQILKLHRNRSDSMASKSRSDQYTIYVEYCRSCDTHSWCTHHDESKYHDTFLKFAEMMAQSFPHYQVIGNMVPHHLIPFKIAENKYIDANTNKYVVYPQIGSFEVRFQGQTIFSKKNTHAWPNLNAVVGKIAEVIDPSSQSPTKLEKSAEKHNQDKQTQKASHNNSFLNSTDERKTYYKDQAKGFTLTDHFKMYRPKKQLEDKDWLTEKYESETSYKQISDAVRGESREKSQKSEESKKSQDVFGESKLKEMLKNKAKMLKDQGKKEMIIKLDSIQEENANYDQAIGATQRTQQKYTKKNKMEQLQAEMSSLQNKFTNFQNRVQDIHARNKQFQIRNQSSDDKSKIKQLIESFKKQERPNVKKELEMREKQMLVDKTNKLEQYLAFNQQEKNQKLHRIYGEWKLIKQFGTKNRKLMKKKQKTSQQQQTFSSDQDTSQAHSHSPSSQANIIAFKPKVQKSNQRKINNVVSQQRGPKYSSIEKYHNSSTSNLASEVKVKTEDNFYKGKNHFFNQNRDNDSDLEIQQTASKLVKKGINTLSMDALKSLGSKQTNQIRQQNGDQPIIFSQSAKANISKIQGRMSNIQQQLNRHKNSGQFSPVNQNPYQKQMSIRRKSKDSSHNNSNKNINSSSYGALPRASYQSVQKSKNHSPQHQNKQRASNFSQLAQIKKMKFNHGHNSSVIKQEFEPMDSQLVSRHQQRQYQDHMYMEESMVSRDSYVKKRASPKKEHPATKVFREKNMPHRELKPQKGDRVRNSSTNSENQNKKGQNKREVSNSRNSRDSKLEKRMKQSRVQRQSNRPVHPEIKLLQKKIAKQSITNKLRLSESKQTVIRPKNVKNQLKKQNEATPKKNVLGSSDQEDRIVSNDVDNVRFGKIKKNMATQQLSSNRHHADQSNFQQSERDYRYQNSNEDKDYQQNQHQNNDQYERFNDDDSEHQKSQNQMYNRPNFDNADNTQNQQIKDAKMRRTLGYFKTEQMCFRGSKTSKESRNVTDRAQKPETSEELVPNPIEDGQLQNQICRNDEQVSTKRRMREQVERPESIEDSDEEKMNEDEEKVSFNNEVVVDKNMEYEQVEGWNLNSSGSEENPQFQLEEKEEQQSQNTKRRNSLDQQLQDQDQVDEQRNSQPNFEQENNKTQEISKVTKTAQNVAKQSSRQDKIRTVALVNDEPEQYEDDFVEQTEKQIVNGQNKQQQQVNQTQEVLAKDNEKVADNQKQLDIQRLVCSQYGQYISTKIQSLVARESFQTQSTSESANVKSYVNQQKDNKQLLTEQRQDSFATFVAEIKPIRDVLVNARKQTKIQQSDKLVDVLASQTKIYMKEIENKITKDMLKQIYPEKQEQIQKDQSLNKVVIIQEPIIAPSTHSVQTTLDEVHSQKQANRKIQAKEQSSQNKSKQTGVANIIIPSALQTKNDSRNSTANAQSFVKAIAPQQKIKENQQVKNSPKTDQIQNIIQKDQIFEDNVYSQSKQPKVSQFKQIGVQKQLTFEVSIQTEVPSFAQQDNIFVVNTNAVHINPSDETHRNTLLSSKSNKNNFVNSGDASGQFEGTIRNNFMSETKRLAVEKKNKKEIIRAKIIDKIYSHDKEEEAAKFQTVIKGNYDLIVRQQGSVIKLQQIYSDCILLGEKSLRVEAITTKFTKLLKVLEILAQKNQWLITRLFQDSKGVLIDKVFGVWICKEYRWQCFILDDCIKVDQEGEPLYTKHSENQIWVNILQKALALSMGGYAELQKADCGKIFTYLTGCNSINVRIKQDPSKNGKLLQLINQSQRKNYTIHAEKNWDKAKEKGRESVYYIMSIRKANVEEQALIELSQDGRQSFWMRLSKFVQQFSKIEVLQLRINHNFAHCDLGIGRQGQMTVIEMDFFEQSQGCVTLSYVGCTGSLRAYLYRQQKSRVLKLVGQAKQKQKSNLFFQCSFSEGKYYVFTQSQDMPARLSYLGEGKPTLKITEEIHSDGLKNQVAEYLPVKQSDDNKGKKTGDLGDSLNSWKMSRAPRLKDNFVQSSLRQNFVEYVLGRSRRGAQ